MADKQDNYGLLGEMHLDISIYRGRPKVSIGPKAGRSMLHVLGLPGSLYSWHQYPLKLVKKNAASETFKNLRWARARDGDEVREDTMLVPKEIDYHARLEYEEALLQRFEFGTASNFQGLNLKDWSGPRMS